MHGHAYEHLPVLLDSMAERDIHVDDVGSGSSQGLVSKTKNARATKSSSRRQSILSTVELEASKARFA